MTEPHPTYTLRPYRHRAGHCSRLQFEAYLPPGTVIRMRCSACGRMHCISIDSTGVIATNGHRPKVDI
jgi:hypothetical protein